MTTVWNQREKFSNSVPTQPSIYQQFITNNVNNMKMMNTLFVDSFDEALNVGLREGFKGSSKKSSSSKSTPSTTDKTPTTATTTSTTDKTPTTATTTTVIKTSEPVSKCKGDTSKLSVEEREKCLEERKLALEEQQLTIDERQQELDKSQQDLDMQQQEITKTDQDIQKSNLTAEPDDTNVDADVDADIEDEDLIPTKSYGDDDTTNEEKEEEEDTSEGFKGKSKKGGNKKSSKAKPKPPSTTETIASKLGIEHSDLLIIIDIFNNFVKLCVVFFATHAWYNNFVIDPLTTNIDDSLEFLSANSIIHKLTLYFNVIIRNTQKFVMIKFPEAIRQFGYMIPFFGRRAGFYALFGIMYFIVDTIIAGIMRTIESIPGFITVVSNLVSGKLKGAEASRTIIQKIVGIFTLSNISVFSGIFSFLYLTAFVSNLVYDETMGIFANIDNASSFVTKLVSMSIFYIIALLFFFAILFNPTVTACIYAAFFGIIYYSFRFMDNTPMYEKMSCINTFINEKPAWFNHRQETGFMSKAVNFIEDAVNLIASNLHQIVFLIFIVTNLFKVFDLKSALLMNSMIGLGTAFIGYIVYSVLEKYNIGTNEMNIAKEQFKQFKAQYFADSNEQEPTKTDTKELDPTNLYDIYSKLMNTMHDKNSK